MNFIKGIETGRIQMKQVGLLKAILIIIVSIFVESFGVVFCNIIKNGNMAIYSNFIIEILFKYISVIIILKLFSEKLIGESNYKKVKFEYFVIIISIIIGFRLFYQYSIGSFVNRLDLNPLVEKAFEELASTPLIFFISVCIVAPVFEEVLFRGIILNGMAKKINEKLAIIISSLLFALMHMNLVQGINAFLLGVILGTIYLKTKSIYLSIFAHLINNTLGILISSYMESLKLSNYFLFQFVVTLVGIIIIILGFCIINRKIKYDN